MEVKRIGKTAIEVSITYTNNIDSFPLFLFSDVHFDNAKCDRKKLKKDLDFIKEQNGIAFCAGDFFCLMEGKYDRRSSKTSGLRPEYLGGDGYILNVIKDAAEFLQPYKNNIVAISDGNHETSIADRMEVNPLALLTDSVKEIEHLPYQGWIIVSFRKPDGGSVRKCKIFFHHGKWGGVISKGTQSISRFSSIAVDADIVTSGHTHDKWVAPHGRLMLLENGEQVQRNQYHVKTGTYKQEFTSGSGWATQTIVQPKQLGGVLVNMTPQRVGIDYSFTI